MTASPAHECNAAQAMNDASPKSAIRTKKLNLWYGTFQALFDVDLEIPRGASPP